MRKVYRVSEQKIQLPNDGTYFIEQVFSEEEPVFHVAISGEQNSQKFNFVGDFYPHCPRCLADQVTAAFNEKLQALPITIVMSNENGYAKIVISGFTDEANLHIAHARATGVMAGHVGFENITLDDFTYNAGSFTYTCPTKLYYDPIYITCSEGEGEWVGENSTFFSNIPYTPQWRDFEKFNNTIIVLRATSYYQPPVFVRVFFPMT